VKLFQKGSYGEKCSKCRQILVGLSIGNIPEGDVVSDLQNSYGMRDNNTYCWLSMKTHHFEWPNGAIKPKWNGNSIGDVFGCGLLLNPANKLSIFFTGNGLLMGQSQSPSLLIL
jgi:hypothetical protein